MGRIRGPALFSSHFGVDAKSLRLLGALDPVLNLDTKLFIDPLRLRSSKQREMRAARQTYLDHFASVIKLLKASKQDGDVPWRNAKRLLSFPEIQGTCLGYGSSSISGSAFGPALTQKLLVTAKAVVDLGITDPDLFVVMAIFEEGVGADRISDMVTNVIAKDLLAFNTRVLSALNVPTKRFTVAGQSAQLAANPKQPNTPVVLVPRDVLRKLPVACCWSDVSGAAGANAALRHRVNTEIGELWKAQGKRDKNRLRKQALANKEAFETLIAAVNATPAAPYDLDADPDGLLFWTRLIGAIDKSHPFKLTLPPKPTLDDLRRLILEIVGQFRKLVEDKGLWKDLWVGPRPRPEAAAQRLFFAIADTYCRANDIDVTPEADSGAGPVDFKFSKSYTLRVLVEVKLSRNTKLVPGFTAQLGAYKKAEGTTCGIYLVIDVGGMGNKRKDLQNVRKARLMCKDPCSDLEFVDGSRQKSASKRKD